MKQYAIPAVVSTICLFLLLDGMVDIVALAGLIGSALYVKNPNVVKGVKKGTDKQPSTW